MKRMRKFLSGVAAASMILGVAGTASADSNKSQSKHVNFHSQNGNVKIDIRFKDSNEAEWALRYITSMQAEGVFSGYEDGTFRPNQAINRIEAVVAAVRLMGLEAEAKAKGDVDLNFKDAAKIKREYGWATGYVAVALEKGLFDSVENELQPGREASRLWVATLLVRALGYQDDALELMNTELEFKDKDQIPAGAVGYIAVAVREGILTGYEDRTFRPNKPVTRAEMAALLHRAGEKLPWEYKLKKKAHNFWFEGTVTDIDDDSITIEDEKGRDTTLEITDHTLVFNDRNRLDTSNIDVGDEVEIWALAGRALLIEIEEEAEQDIEEIKGTVQSITRVSDWDDSRQYRLVIDTDNDDRETVWITASTKIEIEGDSTPTAGEIEEGDRVEIQARGAYAVEVEVEKDDDDNQWEGEFEVKGTIVNMTSSTITIKDENNKQWKFELADDLEIKYEDLDDNWMHLRQGTKVKLQGEDAMVEVITILDVDDEE
ncbi:S-layer homology domain-containing protein [Effusibacillus lacus]|uniref:S-layer protein n=1 Tax=Effusibacillus lacus TaxID=1348429 RepID=A0A292YPW4_9BACL|nr:S-layer homology domain-containing protein [Effusibacillus lacus]TCS68057.1 S-layer family protein [Effusibacillus lacus]GAX90951.1 S-layer protein [Effusibacillus lacus]